MGEHRALRRRKEIIRDKSYGFDGGMSREVVAHGKGYRNDLSPDRILFRTGMRHSSGRVYLIWGKWVERVRWRNHAFLESWNAWHARRRRGRDRGLGSVSCTDMVGMWVR
jgi:hypothetical protein